MSGRSARYKFPIYEILTEGRVELVEVLQILLSGGLIYGICHIVTVIGKCIVATIVSKNNEISDDKAKSMTKMMSKNININLHK